MMNLYNVIFDEWHIVCIPARTLKEAEVEAKTRYPEQAFQVKLDQPRKIVRIPWDQNELSAENRVNTGRANPNWLP